jgi:digeranylgeranylglycerophospholipid reductase
LLDIAIVGGGPIGSRVASQTAGMGYKVAVFEKKSEIGQKLCCTGIVSLECLKRFAIPETVLCNYISSVNLVSPAAVAIRISKEEPQACVLDRSALDLKLASQAKAKGAVYYLNSQVEDLSFSPDKAVIKVNNQSNISNIEAQIVVICAGFCSPLIQKLGLGRIDYLTTGVQTEIESLSLDGVEIIFDQELAPGYFAWLVPTKDNQYLAGLMTSQSPGKRLREWLNKLEMTGRIKGWNNPIRYGGIPLKPLTRTYSDRLLVVGDAAGQVKPTTGGGLYFGLLAADMAADTIQKAIRECDYSARNLSNYERQWRKKFGHELRSEYLARRIYERLNNKQIDGIFSRLNSGGLVESILKHENISFDWHGDLLLMGLKLGITSEISRFIKLPFGSNRR